MLKNLLFLPGQQEIILIRTRFQIRFYRKSVNIFSLSDDYVFFVINSLFSEYVRLIKLLSLLKSDELKLQPSPGTEIII